MINYEKSHVLKLINRCKYDLSDLVYDFRIHIFSANFLH